MNMFDHTMAVIDIFLAETDPRESLEYKRLQRLDHTCLDCGQVVCECCSDCISIGEKCEQCTEDSPDPGQSDEEFQSKCAGVALQGEI